MTRSLTAAQEAFAVLVAGGELTLTDAYLKAYPAAAKWLRKTVHERASEAASDGKIAARIAELRDAAAHTAGLRAADILAELKRLALSDIANVMHADGRVKLPNELDRDTRAAVKKFKLDELGRVEYEFHDKNAALDKAMRYLGLYERDNRQSDGGMAALFALLTGAVVRPDPRAAQPDDDDLGDGDE
jgi:phage terminase small subunit